MLIIALLIIVKIWKKFECPPLGHWTNCGYNHTMEYNSAMKKNKIQIQQEECNLVNIMLSKINQTQKNTYYDFIFMKY